MTAARVQGPDYRAWASYDAFGRSRVSTPVTVFDSKQILDAQPLLWDDQETSGGGTGSSHSTDTASSTLSVGATTAGTRVRQTFRRFNYQPGKSQLILQTFVLDKSGGGTGITRRVGIYDASNGLFIEDAEGTINLVRRTSTSGSPVDNAVAQSAWNLDPMDGTGPSQITLDFSKTQILVIDYEWLGVGRVRIGFNVDGATYYAHEFLNANNLSVVYMSTPNLPLRFEIVNDGTGAASTLEAICCSVISEGGVQPGGIVRYVSTAGTHLDLADENTLYALIGIRLKAAAVAATVEILDVSLQLQTANHKVEWQLLWNPTVANTFTYGNQTNSAVQTVLGGATNTVTNGTILAGGWLESGGVSTGAGASLSRSVPNALLLGAAIDGTLDQIVLAIRPVDGSTDVDIEGSLTWREII